MEAASRSKRTLHDNKQSKFSHIFNNFVVNASFQIKAIYPIALEGANKMIKFIKKQTLADNEKSFNARDLSARFTCDVVTSCVMSTEAYSFMSTKSEIHKLMENITRGIMDSVLSGKPMKLIPAQYENSFIRLMTDAISHRLESNEKRDDFLSHIVSVKQRKSQSDIEAAAHGWTLYFDSYETTSIVMMHALYEIANDKRVQDKLREEIFENLDADGNLSFEKISELKYLDQVFYEVLRLHPPFMFTTKVCSEEIELVDAKDHKFMMEKDSTVLISIYSIHRDPGECEFGCLCC